MHQLAHVNRPLELQDQTKKQRNLKKLIHMSGNKTKLKKDAKIKTDKKVVEMKLIGLISLVSFSPS